ncbi:E3 ubiquitin-protein ligase RNF34 [Ostrinia nubilalis]|uniref:E3 ubiquitin-protein ligase RNF34 n=1 Tax=Ostrinia nubilalis TaxID=29057 RepID=UPI00308244F9
MPCESCAVQFSVFRRKRACCECERYFCSGCLRRGGGVMCAACRLLSTRPLSRQAIAHLKVRDLQCFLQRQNVSTRGCVEKEELVSLCVGHVNSAAYRRRGARAPGPFSTLKDFTKLINNAFDLRAPAQPAPPPPNSNCYNAAHTHEPAPAPSPARERFTTTPGGERDIEVPVPPGVSRSTSGSSGARRDTADCFEIEDLDDAGWEFVTRPADPLPNDSEVLITENEMHTPAHEPDRTTTVRVEVHAPGVSAQRPREGAGLGAGAGPGAGAGRLQPERAGATPQRAASELELRRDPPPDSDTTSLQDEPMMDRPPEPETPRRVSLGALRSAAELEALSVRQLKELLARNRVAYTGCLERADLLQRAQLLWRDHAAYKDEIDNLPLEECCKICMSAPLECVLLECGHIAACTPCAARLAECPICRQYVVRAVRFFRS